MKSNIEKVYSKLPKVELATQKVELGLVDDLFKNVKNVCLLLNKMNNEIVVVS